MRAVEDQLIRETEQMVLLFTPPFEKANPDPGYISNTRRVCERTADNTRTPRSGLRWRSPGKVTVIARWRCSRC